MLKVTVRKPMLQNLPAVPQEAAAEPDNLLMQLHQILRTIFGGFFLPIPDNPALY